MHYAGFDTDLSTPASVDDQINTNDYSVTDPIIEKCSFQINTFCLSPDIAFQVHLLSQMNTHRGNDRNMFNEVIYYHLKFLQPTLHSVPLTDGSVATVLIFDVKALLIAFLNDPLRMHHENFASNYDIFTGKAKLPTSTLDEIHTG